MKKNRKITLTLICFSLIAILTFGTYNLKNIESASATEISSTIVSEDKPCVVVNFGEASIPSDLKANISLVSGEKLKNYKDKVSKKINFGKIACLYEIRYESNGEAYSLSSSPEVKVFIPNKIRNKDLTLVTFSENGTMKIITNSVTNGDYISVANGYPYIGIVYNSAGTTVLIFISILVAALVIAIVWKVIKIRHSDPDYIKAQKHAKRPKKQIK